MSNQAYVIDADVLIAAKNSYYGFDICPGFWDSLLHHHEAGRVFSLDEVKDEIFEWEQADNLIDWVNDRVPPEFFIGTQNPLVASEYSDIMQWVNQHPQYRDEAKTDFTQGADGWLIAHAKLHDITLVTNEKSAPNSERRIFIPDVGRHFGVDPINTFEMLGELGVRLDFTPPRK